MGSVGLIVIIVGGVLALGSLALGGWAIGIYNSLVSIKNSVEQAFSNIDVLLKQRHNELTKLVEVVKGVKDFEQETLVKVTEARKQFDMAGNQAQALAAGAAEGLAISGLFAVAEQYPELKSNQNFMQLQTRISELEDQIADRREVYNDSVNIFNTRIEQFPDTLVANLLNYRRRQYFKVSEEHRKDVKISF